MSIKTFKKRHKNTLKVGVVDFCICAFLTFEKLNIFNFQRSKWKLFLSNLNFFFKTFYRTFLN